MSRVLSAPLEVSFDYTRSLGPVLSQFMTGLRERTVLGARGSDGKVIVPPVEFDPVTHEALTELVPVSPTGTVQTWSWVSEPVLHQPLDRPFAFALVLLDGADTPILHAVDAPYDAMRTGLRVTVRWAEETQGHITDIACFVPADDQAPAAPELWSAPAELVEGIITPTELHYIYEASPEESSFFRGLSEGRLVGQRCPKCQKVYVPPRGACPVDGVPTAEEVELPDTGIVTTFCVVNVPFLGQRIEIPYVSAYILLDGADIGFLHLIQGVPADQVRMGMRVKAVWKPRDEWGTTVENIKHFEPTGEPDADYETFKDHL
ncbi:MAG TPA: OB-fold domain-containing protein, partial [Nocardioidaceae bacterium]|nr:OB-fold domain-containing protein [Nocardioidaceae bacterium]